MLIYYLFISVVHTDPTYEFKDRFNTDLMSFNALLNALIYAIRL